MILVCILFLLLAGGMKVASNTISNIIGFIIIGSMAVFFIKWVLPIMLIIVAIIVVYNLIVK